MFLPCRHSQGVTTMNGRLIASILIAALVSLPLLSWSANSQEKKTTFRPPQKEKVVPTFSLAWSEYPSWSVFGVASELGLIDGRQGHQGELEKKWGVDIVLELM